MLKFLSPIFKRSNNLNAGKDHVALIEAIMQSLNGLDQDTVNMKLELMILTATGRWLNTWGEWFGVPRLNGEPDDIYSKRIIATTIKPKNTIPAIIDAINEVGGYDGGSTSIFEPHKFIARYSVSKFSGKDRFQDGSYWRAGVIDLNIPFDITGDIKDTVESVKAAGIKVYFTHNNQIWVPEDSWKFSDNFIPYEDYTLIFQPALSIALKGAVFSSNSKGARNRSGKQTLWGNFVDLGFDLTPTRHFERYMGESMVLSREDFLEYILLPVEKGRIFSHRIGGVLSGGEQGKFEIIDHFDPTKKTDLQGNVIHQVYNLRPATRSHHAVFSGRYGFSGAPDENWIDKPYVLVTDTKAVFEYHTKRLNSEHTVFQELTFGPNLQFNKSRRSGRQILFVSDLLTIQTDLTMSHQKRELTFNDPYKWVDFMYAVRKNDEELKKQILSEELGNRSGMSLEEVFKYDSTITVNQLDEWGINIQKDVERNVIYLGSPYRSVQGRRSGKYPMSGVYGDKADAIQRPLIAELVGNPYHASVDSENTFIGIELETEAVSTDLEMASNVIYIETGELMARRDILMSSMFRFEDITPEVRTYKTALEGSYKNHTEIVTEATTVNSFIDFQHPFDVVISN